MPIQILMPALSPTMTEGNLAKWLKKPGDVVKAGQVIAEIETDKATMEVEAVDEGKIAKILVAAGAQGVKVNAPIAILAVDGESIEQALASVVPVAMAPSSAAASAAAPSPAIPEKEQNPLPLAGRVGEGGAPSAPSSSASRLIASPLAKRIAEQLGVNLKTVRGSGPNGRIVKADVEKQRQASPSATPAVGNLAKGMDARDYADKLGQGYDALPNTAIRKIIARRLAESKQTVPHFYLTIDCEIDALLELRKGWNEAADTKISVNDFIIRATALAMKKLPAVNVSWTDDALLQYKDIDVSVAVATPTGLVTPIVKQADTKTVAQISAEMKDLAARARDGKLRPQEFQGGGFSISNLGMFGIREFAAIINPPQSCILAVGKGEQRAVVKNGQLAIANVMTCTLSIDHRAVDGAVGAEFLSVFKPLIEKPHALVV